MHQAIAFTSLLLTSLASAQGVLSKIAPNGTAPAGCAPTFPWRFAVEQMNVFANNNGRHYVASFENFGLPDSILDENEPIISTRTEVALIEGKIAAPSIVSHPDCINATPGLLNLTLSGTVLTDSHNRTGYIASNNQWQFDSPPQAGAISTAGYSVCSNGSLALGSSTIWWLCRSGDFSNIYNADWAPQCIPQHLVAKKIC